MTRGAADLRIVLIGLRGSGKSTVGEELAHHLDLPFFDTDREIARRWGQDPGVVLDEEGEAELRRRERLVVHELSAETRGVLALGGGAVLDDRNRRDLAAWQVVRVDAPDDVLHVRNESAYDPIDVVLDGNPIAELSAGDGVDVHFRDEVATLAQLPGSNFYRRIREKFGHLAH